tara:strand:- start:1102 stop:1299 length:198 start_codon:yes stop_codon:yes gene_type:complete
MKCDGTATFGKVRDIYNLEAKGYLTIFITGNDFLRCQITQKGIDLCCLRKPQDQSSNSKEMTEDV